MNTYSNENFTFLIVRILELYTRKVCEMFVNKHSETREYIKNQPAFYEKYKLYGQITQEFLRSRMRNFQGSIFT